MLERGDRKQKSGGRGKLFFYLLFPFLGFLPALSFSDEVELTVYNQNLGLVREERELELKEGRRELAFTDVAASLDPTSVHFKSLTAPESLAVLEQNFEYDLISRNRLLEKFIDRDIEIKKQDQDKEWLIKGKLLSTAGGLVVKSGDKLYLNPEGMVILPQLPDHFVTKPTLSWLLENKKPGRHKIEISYLTGNINWKADYVFVVDKENKKADLNGWVTIDNQSGKTYNEAKLKLVAGDVNRVSPEGRGRVRKAMAMEASLDSSGGFQEKEFFEYHLYTLGRRSTVKDRETKQVEFASGLAIPVDKIFVYEGQKNEKKVQVKLEFANKKESGMGIPLPKGRVRAYQPDDDGSLIFLGEDEIDHTPKDEKLSLAIGNAFDIAGERKQSNYQSGNDWRQESYEITLKNHKKEVVEVKVREYFWGWSNWKILTSSKEHRKKDAQTAEFTLRIPADGEVTLSYTVKYWW